MSEQLEKTTKVPYEQLSEETKNKLTEVVGFIPALKGYETDVFILSAVADAKNLGVSAASINTGLEATKSLVESLSFEALKAYAIGVTMNAANEATKMQLKINSLALAAAPADQDKSN